MVTYKLVNNVVSQLGKTEGVGEGLAAGLHSEGSLDVSLQSAE